MSSQQKKRGRSLSNRRQEILQVAARLFASKGYESTSIREIGDAAGILSGSLYHHFKSKEEMLQDLLKSFLTKLIPLYKGVVTEKGEVIDILRKLIATGLNTSIEHSAELTVIVQERRFLNRSPDFSYVNDVMLEVEGIWHDFLQEGVRTKQFRNDLEVNLVLRTIMDLIFSTVSWYVPETSRYSLDQIVDNQLELLFNGLKNTTLTGNNNNAIFCTTTC